LGGRRTRPAPPGEGRAFDLYHDDHHAVVFSGRLFNPADIAKDGIEDDTDATRPAALIAAAYARDGLAIFNRMNGPYACALVELASGSLLLGRDHLGLEPLYYHHGSQGLCFASSIKATLRAAGLAWEIDPQALARTMLFNYNPGRSTWARGVQCFPPAHVLRITPNGEWRWHRYWRLSFTPRWVSDERVLREELLERLRQAVVTRLPQDATPGLFVSGGLDSSTVTALAAERQPAPMHTYAFRCDLASVDESQHAQRMAEFVGAEHQRIEYGPDRLSVMAEAVQHMAQPFDEAGINIASYLLGQAAMRRDGIILTGDGGDELFAGHPVYQADAAAQKLDALPGVLRQPIVRTLQLLPDSQKKQDLLVKLKRFAEGSALPAALLSNRWRAHYQPSQLQDLLTAEVAETINWDHVFDEVIEAGQQADGPDLLSRALHADYHSIVHFYLRRNDMLRALGVEVRCPLFDPRLVEYCAAIPSAVKVPRWSAGKELMRKTVDPILPADIAHRQDKLGHTVPMKNWLRDNVEAQQFVFDVLSDQRLQQRGLVKPARVRKLIDDHRQKRRNNAHRLWTLAVIELWMQAHVDGG
jgi:asparagine synthase (glutamine-hydrolysing)